MMQATIRSGLSKGGAIGMSQWIAQFSAFVNRAWSFRRYVTRNSVRPGELAKQPLQSVPAALYRRIVLRVRPFQIGLRHQAWATVTGTNDVHHVQIVLFNQPVKMDVEKVQSRCRAPMSQQTGFDMFEP